MGSGQVGPTGLTLEEIKRLASEVGLESTHIEAAAGELDNAPQTGLRRLLRNPPAVELVREVPGVVGPEEWQAMVAELRKTFGGAGQSSEIAGGYDWTGGDKSYEGGFTASPTSHGTRLRLFVDHSTLDVLGWLMAVPVALFITAGTGTTLHRAGLGLAEKGLLLGALALALVVMGRWLLARWLDRDRRRLPRVMDRLESLAQPSHTPPLTEVREQESVEPQIARG